MKFFALFFALFFGIGQEAHAVDRSIPCNATGPCGLLFQTTVSGSTPSTKANLTSGGTLNVGVNTATDILNPLTVTANSPRGMNVFTGAFDYGPSIINQHSGGRTLITSNADSTAVGSEAYAKRATIAGSSLLSMGIADGSTAFEFRYSPVATTSGSSVNGFWTSALGTIDTSGLMTHPGGVKLKTSGAGSDTLNWYEEGTFAPTLFANGTNYTSVTYSLQNGKFTRLGRILFYTIDIRWTNTSGSPTGVIGIGNMPYSCTGYHNSSPLGLGNIDTPTGALDCFIQSPTGGGTTFFTDCSKDNAAEQGIDAAVNAGAASRGFAITGFCQL